MLVKPWCIVTVDCFVAESFSKVGANPQFAVWKCEKPARSLDALVAHRFFLTLGPSSNTFRMNNQLDLDPYTPFPDRQLVAESSASAAQMSPQSCRRLTAH